MEIFQKILTKDEINRRFVEAVYAVITHEPISKSALAESMNVKPAKFSEILNKRMKAGMDIIQKLCDEYNVSADWIITGRGDMFLNNCQNETSIANNSDNISPFITILQNTLVEKDKQIESLLTIIKQGKE